MSHRSSREVGVGLLVVLAIAGLAGLMVVSGGGPGFLAPRRTIDVVFRDGQGLRVGSPVRVAGIDSGRVESIDLAEVEGILRARVRVSIPTTLAVKLRQDVKVAVQSGLTGQCIVNIVSSGRSSVALVPGQVVMGVESSFFDPVLEQVGLGPVERSHLSHTIAEVRQTVDAASPRLRQGPGCAPGRRRGDAGHGRADQTQGRRHGRARRGDRRPDRGRQDRGTRQDPPSADRPDRDADARDPPEGRPTRSRTSRSFPPRPTRSPRTRSRRSTPCSSASTARGRGPTGS